jgi:hypothetical protein
MMKVELTRMVELENHDSLIQPAACGQGIDGLDSVDLNVNNNKNRCFFCVRIKNFKNVKSINMVFTKMIMDLIKMEL